MGWQVVNQFNQIVLFGPNEGLYIYSSTPANGNLIGTVGLNAPGHDQFGNPTLPGDVSYNPGNFAIQNFNGELSFYVWHGAPLNSWGSSVIVVGLTPHLHNAAIVPGVWDLQLNAGSGNIYLPAVDLLFAAAGANYNTGLVGATAVGQLELDSPQETATDTAAQMFLQSAAVTTIFPQMLIGTGTLLNAPFLLSQGNNPNLPNKVATDTWQTIAAGSFLNGWTQGATGVGRYAMLPQGIATAGVIGNFAHIDLDAVPGTLTDGTAIFNIPAPYRPIANKNIPVGTRGATAPSNNAPFVQVTTSGNVNIFSAPATATSIRVNGSYPLN